MNQPQPLFQDEQIARAALDIFNREVFSFVERLWSSFCPYADTAFKREMNRAVCQLYHHKTLGADRDAASFFFHQRFWEMYAGCALLDQGILLVPRAVRDPAQDGAGPDLLADIDGRRVWVECAAPEPGTGPDRVPEVPLRKVTTVPEDQIKLRLLSAVATKQEKWTEYLKAGIVDKQDGFVLAINSASVPYASCDIGAPLIVRALYGMGDYALGFNPSTNEWSEPLLTPQTCIRKEEGGRVEMGHFGSGSAKNISGALHSTVDAWNLPDDFSSGVDYIHNCTADVPLPDRWLPRSVSYSVSMDGGRGTIIPTRPQ